MKQKAHYGLINCGENNIAMEIDYWLCVRVFECFEPKYSNIFVLGKSL